MNDKLLHGLAGLFICTLTGLALYHLGCSANFSKGAGLLTAFAAGAAKETFDAIKAKAFNVRTWDMFDFLATCVGGFAGVFILIVVFKIN
jgi:ABC-type molybdate transport system substrate-binding protein